jgi:hypothetical protein
VKHLEFALLAITIAIKGENALRGRNEQLGNGSSHRMDHHLLLFLRRDFDLGVKHSVPAQQIKVITI